MKKFTQFLFLMLLCLLGDNAFSQVKIGDNPTSVNPNALLEMESSSKGLLLPRLTNDQIKAMTNVPAGMLLFSTTDSALYLKRDTGWAVLGFKTQPAASPWKTTGSGDIYNTNPGKVGIGTNTPYSLLSNISENVLDKEGYGGNAYSSFNWQSNGFGYAGMISNFGDGRGLLVRTAEGAGNSLEVDAGDHNLLNVLASGNVGIGTATPATKLDVAGDMKVSGNVTIDGDVTVKGKMKVDIIDTVLNYTLEGSEMKSLSIGCPTGYKVIGGGGGHRDANYYQQFVEVNFSGPDPNVANHWRVLLTNTTPDAHLEVQAYAICAGLK